MIFSWLQLFWLCSTLLIGIAGSIVLLFPELSLILGDLVKYGKSPTKKKNPVFNLISVPKRWFTHFYIVAVVSSSFWAVQLYLINSGVSKLPPILRDLLIFLVQPHMTPTVDRVTGCVVLGAIWIHCLRRLFESWFVSVYSQTEMNVLHYMIGWVHYISLPLCLLVEVVGVLNTKQNVSTEFSEQNYYWLIPGLAMFVFCSYQQHKCLEVFAKMRKNYLGNITNYAHGIPYGGYFELVSCPQFLFEIGIYFSLYLCLHCQHRLWVDIVGFVVTNQLIAALITHKWYKERFGHKYPSDRKAIIPFVL